MGQSRTTTRTTARKSTRQGTRKSTRQGIRKSVTRKSATRKSARKGVTVSAKRSARPSAKKASLKKAPKKTPKRAFKKALKKALKKAVKKTPKKAVKKTLKKTVKKALKTPKKAPKKALKTSKKVLKISPKKTKKTKKRVLLFSKGEYVIYPTHGLGRVMDVRKEEVGGHKGEFFVVEFEHSRMTLRIPTVGTQVKNMRKLSGVSVVGKAFAVLRTAARVQRTMWSRRAQQYEAKINSGSLVSLAEVVRDLYRTEEQPESSYSERQLFQEALDRMTREVAVVQKIAVEQVKQEVHHVLAGSVPVAQSDRATAS